MSQFTQVIIDLDQPGSENHDLADTEANGEEPTTEVTNSVTAIQVDPEDDQRGPVIRSNEHAVSLTTDEIFTAWFTSAIINNVVVTPTHRYSKDRISAKLRFRYPQFQRASVILELRVPRLIDADDNPARQVAHIIHIKIPANKIRSVTFHPLNASTDPTTLHPKFQIRMENSTLAAVNIVTDQVVVQGLVLPRLLTSDIQAQAQDIMNTALAASESSPLTVNAIMEVTDNDTAKLEIRAFKKAMSDEKQIDPINIWFEGTPRKQVLNVGNLTKVLNRPDIPIQRAETVFADAKEYQMHHVYSATYENDFNRLAVTGYEDIIFDSRMLHFTASISQAGALPTAYLCFISLDNLQLERPEVGSRLKVTLELDAPNPQYYVDPEEPEPAFPPSPRLTQSQALAQAAAQPVSIPVPLSKSEAGDIEEEYDEVDVAQVHKEVKEEAFQEYDFFDVNGYAEREDDFFDDAQDNLKKEHNPNLWVATVIESTITPPAHICCIVERRREPLWQGPAEERPYVLTEIPSESDRHLTIKDLATAVQKAPLVRIKVKPDHSEQTFKDEVRSCDAFFSATDAKTIALREYLLRPSADDSEAVNLLQCMGPADTTKDFTPSQLELYYSTASIKKGIMVVHGPYGSGKTTCILSIMLKYQSSPKAPKLMYTTSSNAAVDDAARKYEKLAAQHGIVKTIIRVHSLKSEKAAILHDKKRYRSRFVDVEDSILFEFIAVAYTTELADDHEKKRKCGDPRRVLQNLSLSEAMLKFMDKHCDMPEMRRLKSELQLILKNGMEGHDKVQVARQVNFLLSATLAEADAIFSTLNSTTKVKLYENFQPDVIVIDEACRSTELSNIGTFAFYKPEAYFLVGDPNQLRPTLLTAGREKDFYATPFVNPFQRQGLLSLHERLGRCGHPIQFLREQHRCQGGISYFPSHAFYYGRVEDANKGKLLPEAVRSMRQFSLELGLRKPSNTILLTVSKSRSSKSTGSESSINPDHVHATIEKIVLLLQRHFTKLHSEDLGTVTIAAMYRAQVNLYRQEVQKLAPELQKRIQVRTIDGMQGYEDDCVVVDMVRSKGAGFTGQMNRFNVACTRAILLFILVVNPDMLDGIEHVDKQPSTKYVDKMLKYCLHTQKAINVEAVSNTCNQCSQHGHISQNCPLGKPCKNCGAFGHARADCTEPRSETHIQCRNCKEMGHRKANCPEPKILTCKNCGANGHMRKDCHQQEDLSTVQCDKCKLFGHWRKDCTTRITLQHWNVVRNEKKARDEAGRAAHEVAGTTEPPTNLDAANIIEPEATTTPITGFNEPPSIAALVVADRTNWGGHQADLPTADAPSASAHTPSEW